MWEHFKSDFYLSHHKLRDAKVTSTVEGYQSTNDLYQKDMINTITKLASATAHDCQTVVKLSATNSTFTLDITTVKKNIVTALLDVTKLSIKLSDIKSKSGVSTSPLGTNHY